MLAIQFVVSIIYIGSWVTFILVRIPRVVWGLLMQKFKLNIFLSARGINIMKADWILRLTTLVIYIGLSFGFSVWLPEHFCELMSVSEDSFSSCKWQVFGFRLVFILMYLPIELIMLAVVYRNATDNIFKIQLRKITGVNTDAELTGLKKKSTGISHLMSRDVVINRNPGASTGSFAQAVDHSPDAQMNRSSSLNMSERRMLGDQSNRLADVDHTGGFLPEI